MIATLGHGCLWLAAGSFAWTLWSSVVSRSRLDARARRLPLGMIVGASGVAGAAALLAFAFLTDQFALLYVSEHSKSSMPLALKLAASWSGQEGSLLLWALLCAVFGALATARRQGTAIPVDSHVLPSALCLFLVLLLCTSADPFVGATGRAALAGRGLGQSLQHWAMVLHPPALLAGYALASIPAAMVLGALAVGGLDRRVAACVRPWAFFGWISLGAGMVLGAWWAYIQLGWGGYWAWDPVENAALMPWLTCTALVHTLGVQERTGRMVRWSAVLAALTFLLSILGACITRGGAVQSVHAFARGNLGSALLACLVAMGSLSAVLIASRWRCMEQEPARADRREWLVGVGNACLVTMAAVVLFGTLLSTVSAGLFAHAVGVGPSFYARTVVPLGAVGLLLMLAATPKVGCRGVPRIALLPRTIGMLGAHLGVILVAVGIAGSAGFQSKSQVTLARGETAAVGRFAVRLLDMQERRGLDRGIVQAAVEVRDWRGRTSVLRPERVFADLSEEVGSHAAIQSRLTEDVYVSLVGWDVGASRVTLTADINPLVVWIWIGSGLVLLGCVPAAIALALRDSRRRPATCGSRPIDRPLPVDGPLAAGGLT